MTEANQVNGAVRANLGPLGRFVRVESSIDAGIPDFYYRLRGIAGWLECKLIPPSGRAPKHFTLDQLLWGEEEVRYGGRWFFLGLREPRTWLVYDVKGARSWLEQTRNEPVLEIAGRFPTKEITLILAPRKPKDHADNP